MAETAPSRLPFYQKAALILIGLIAFFYILYIGRYIIIPLAFAFIFSILLNPLVNFLHRHKVNRVLAITIVLIVAIAVLAGLFYFITWQLVQFRETVPA